VSVNFNDIFCSAKNDCVNGSGGDIDLLFDAAGARARTLVLGFACTAGTGAGIDTQLYLDDLALECSAPNSGSNFAADILLRPDAPHTGNLCVAGAMSGCAPSVTELRPGVVDADTYLFQVAVYRGEEALTSGGAAGNKQYWNVALGVTGDIVACRLPTQATHDDATDAGDLVTGGTIAARTVYPYVQWDVDLASCGAEALAFGDPAAPVRAEYTRTGDQATTFAYPWAPGLPPLCAPACANGGGCVATDWCECATGWQGATCLAAICAPACLHGGQCTAPDTCGCAGTGAETEPSPPGGPNPQRGPG